MCVWSWDLPCVCLLLLDSAGKLFPVPVRYNGAQQEHTATWLTNDTRSKPAIPFSHGRQKPAIRNYKQHELRAGILEFGEKVGSRLVRMGHATTRAPVPFQARKGAVEHNILVIVLCYDEDSLVISGLAGHR